MTGEVFLVLAFFLSLIYGLFYVFLEIVTKPKRDHELYADTNDLVFAMFPSGLLYYTLVSLSVSSLTLGLGCALCILFTYKVL